MHSGVQKDRTFAECMRLNPFEFRACIRARETKECVQLLRLNPFEFRACIRALQLKQKSNLSLS